MSKRVLILVEGQTEERFTKDVLGPAFWEKQLFLQPTILMTKKVKNGPNFKGGVTNFPKFKNDLQRLLNSAGGALVTTMLDYYGLPADFPGMNTRPNGTSKQRVLHVEAAIATHFGNLPNFLPFLALHEFEAWLFSSPVELPRIMNEPQKQVLIEAVRAAVNTPEEINERPQFAPSKRIESMFSGYKKTLHGPTVTARIGLERIREECPHFHEWLAKLEAYADK
ncbi:MAG TPA: DUF4276 family protein [Candidatus Sulfotelmatobacter sp.]|jgi:hypothetical protein|nr:DUF4276 family protein [Candidatus Sulfotelmatobacter sp.]